MRIVFFGATELGHQCCQTIYDNELANIVGIFTIPKKFKISYADKHVTNVLYKDFKSFQSSFGIPVIEINGSMSDYSDQIALMRPDFLLVIGWYYMIPKSIRKLAERGCAGIHASLLPKYRGGAPLVWAMINGEKEAGVTLFYFGDGVDDGDIIAQRNFLIRDKDTIKDVLNMATHASVEIVKEYIPKIANGTAPRIVQNRADATQFPQRKPEDGLIDWAWDNRRIYNFIRAQTRPYPGAYTIINGKKVFIWDADIISINDKIR